LPRTSAACSRPRAIGSGARRLEMLPLQTISPDWPCACRMRAASLWPGMRERGALLLAEPRRSRGGYGPASRRTGGACSRGCAAGRALWLIRCTATRFSLYSICPGMRPPTRRRMRSRPARLKRVRTYSWRTAWPVLLPRATVARLRRRTHGWRGLAAGVFGKRRCEARRRPKGAHCLAGPSIGPAPFEWSRGACPPFCAHTTAAGRLVQRQQSRGRLANRC